MNLILIKNRVSHLLSKGGSRGLMGNESGLNCNRSQQEMNGGIMFNHPPWVVSKFIFLKAEVWAQAPLKASSGSYSFIVQVCV